MLQSLHVKNLALIDESEVNFQDGLNILTGETGAGKSILIGSINLALGGKADKDMIRTGAEYGYVELVFSTNEWLREQLKSFDLSTEDDGTLIIQRKIMPQKSIIKICGETVTLKQVKDLASFLIDIHGQHEHQSLLHRSKQLQILDEFSRQEIQDLKQELKNHVQKLVLLLDKQESMQLDENSRNREMALLEFEIREIEAASLKEDEDLNLELQYRKMLHSKKIMEVLSFVYALTGADDKDSGKETIGRALRELKTVVNFDQILVEKEKQLMELETLLFDFNHEIAAYMEDLEFEQDEFAKIEARLNEINRLKSKYGSSIIEISNYLEKQRERFEDLCDYEERFKKLL
jgi:DNA repair protein RecN (Recombination protein N)